MRAILYLQDIGSVELAILTYHIVNTIISIYCVLCVSSQLHDLIHGKGTKDYYRRMVSNPSPSGNLEKCSYDIKPGSEQTLNFSKLPDFMTYSKMLDRKRRHYNHNFD